MYKSFLLAFAVAIAINAPAQGLFSGMIPGSIGSSTPSWIAWAYVGSTNNPGIGANAWMCFNNGGTYFDSDDPNFAVVSLNFPFIGTVSRTHVYVNNLVNTNYNQPFTNTPATIVPFMQWSNLPSGLAYESGNIAPGQTTNAWQEFNPTNPTGLYFSPSNNNVLGYNFSSPVVVNGEAIVYNDFEQANFQAQFQWWTGSNWFTLATSNGLAEYGVGGFGMTNFFAAVTAQDFRWLFTNQSPDFQLSDGVMQPSAQIFGSSPQSLTNTGTAFLVTTILCESSADNVNWSIQASNTFYDQSAISWDSSFANSQSVTAQYWRWVVSNSVAPQNNDITFGPAPLGSEALYLFP